MGTLEIEVKSNKSAQSCSAILETDVQCYAKKLKNLTCIGVKRFDIETGAAVQNVDWKQSVMKYYNKSCLVEEIGIQNRNNIWTKVFGENERVKNSVNAQWIMKMVLEEPATKPIKTWSLSYKSDNTMDTDLLFEQLDCTAYVDTLFLDTNTYFKKCNKEQHFVRSIHNITTP